ncbi:variant erythrocyte surface antigen-1 family protein [Babesia caballi]|uniref:Variant erythrocyte surface antigen-1 family protein n=1 Tax=Babesia caballi TaxID=5871 RepID=A0AAV4LNF6_BABCB|nr:variant erythrocyte surface antigen-1 family protein [Babesia caballi]
MTSDQKKLTQPPTYLKEAIDWVLQIKDHAQELAAALDALLKNDGSEVAMKVLYKYRLVSESVIKGLEDANKKQDPPTKPFYFAHTALNNLSKGMIPFHSQSAAHVSRETAEQWVEMVQETAVETLISDLAKGFESFRSGIVQGSNNSAYSNLDRNTHTPSAKTDCAAILLGIMPVVYIGITYLYWQCAGTGGWHNQKLSEENDLRKFMVALGYQSNQLANKNGSTIVSSVMNNMFSSELKTAYGSSKTHYFNFLSELQKKVLDSTPSQTKTDCPLTSLYALSYYYITNFLYIVETTSPATPSFAGYSGLGALAGGAYGFNFGGLGTFMGALLA